MPVNKNISLKVVVAGFGTAARAHIDALTSIDGYNVCAVYSPVPEREVPQIRELLGEEVKVYSDYAQMLQDEGPDLVSICTIHDEHADQAILAAGSGAHIILEKPYCIEFTDLQCIQDAVDRAGVKVCAGFHEFHHGQFRSTLDLIEQGLLGDLHLVEIDYYHGVGPWVPQFWWAKTKIHGGSSLLVAGCHALQFLLLCMAGDEVEEVTSYSSKSSAKDFDEMEYAGTQVSIFKFKSGRIGKVTSCIDSLQPYTFRSTVIGSEGSAIDDKYVSRKIGNSVLDKWSQMDALRNVDGIELVGEMFVPMFESFLEDIRGGAPIRFSGFTEVMNMHRVLFAADKSAEMGRPISIDEFDLN